jgi:hypothetical protein
LKEIKSWDGSVNKNMIIRETIPYGHVDIEEKSEQAEKSYTIPITYSRVSNKESKISRRDIETSRSTYS